jgi:hypothetical protein
MDCISFGCLELTYLMDLDRLEVFLCCTRYAPRQELPRRLHAFFQLILPSAYPRRVVLFGDADAGMAEQDRDLIDGNAGQKHLNGEGVSEHMAVATLWRAVRLAEIGDFE